MYYLENCSKVRPFEHRGRVRFQFPEMSMANLVSDSITFQTIIANDVTNRAISVF